jgi:alcohol dehydrogenase YqhD (iron-dependent ADH family)
MKPFVYHIPTRVEFKRGGFSSLGKIAKKVGKKPLVVVGRRWAKESGYLKRALDLLREEGLEPIVYGGIEPNPTLESVDKGASLFLEEKADFFIALGGGSVMDATKAMALVAGSGGSAWDYALFGGKSKREATFAYPVITVPTTAGTSSEADSVAVISKKDTREKMPIASDLIFPKIALVDPELALTLPKEVTAQGVVDMLTHVLEPYISATEDFPVSDLIAESLMKRIIESGSRAIEDGSDLSAREELAWLSILSMWAIHKAGRGGPFSMHYIEHVLSGFTDCPHANGLACLLVPWLKKFSDEKRERLEKLALALFGKKDADALLDWFSMLLERWEMKFTLSDLGLKADLEEVAWETLRLYGWVDGKVPGPTALDHQDLLSILSNCL